MQHHTPSPTHPSLCSTTTPSPPTPTPKPARSRAVPEVQPLLAAYEQRRRPPTRVFSAKRAPAASLRGLSLAAAVAVGGGTLAALLLLCHFLMDALLDGSHKRAALAMSLGAGMATGLGACGVLLTR